MSRVSRDVPLHLSSVIPWGMPAPCQKLERKSGETMRHHVPEFSTCGQMRPDAATYAATCLVDSAHRRQKAEGRNRLILLGIWGVAPTLCGHMDRLTAYFQCSELFS
jgi:hypothetical protein